MNTNIKFANLFNKKMLFLSTLIGVIISISMPLTYFILLMEYENEQANTHSYQLAHEMQSSVSDKSNLWQFNGQKLIEVFDNYDKVGISSINVYDEKSRILYKNKFSDYHSFDLRSRAPIVYSNRTYGYVEITENISKVVYTAIVLLIIFSLAGLGIGIILYRFPSKIVKRSEEEISKAFHKLNHLSYHDMLTNLPNRLKFNESLNKLLEDANKDKRKIALMFLDLDRFKLINDTLGHNCGDILLQSVAKRLTDSVRRNDIVARLGGDEFTIILPNINNITQAAIVAGKILKSFNNPFILDGNEFTITTSIGISIYPTDGLDIDTLIKNADAAMYFAKDKGNNKYQFYSPSMDTASLERLSMENDLRKALERKEFLLYYQPIVEADSQKITGVETLVRWNHPEKGLLKPEYFLSLAKETGIIASIDEWVLKEVCNQLKQWQRKGLPYFYISVNISERMFQKKQLVQEITKILKDTELKAKYLQLEITECIAMNDEENIVSKLNLLKDMGVRIAIDDFGTGYSSLNRLKKFPIHTLKIDKSFIENITLNSNDLAITTSIISLAYNLDLNVIAEGVENIKQVTLLREHGCDELQGYYFSKPITADEFEKLVIMEHRYII